MTVKYILGVLLGLSSAWAESKPEIDKTKFNFFNPVPNSNLRDFETDDCPYTIDPGHMQIETILYDYISDRFKTKNEYTRTHTYSVFAPNVRFGLTHNFEVAMAATGFTREHVRDVREGTRETHNGFGDLLLKVKYNLWGNEGDGDSAVAIQPVLKLPTSNDNVGNKYVEGSLKVPTDIKLMDQLTLAVVPEIEVRRGENERRHVAAFILPVTFQWNVTEEFEWDMGLEFERAAEKKARFANSLQFEAKYQVSPRWLINGGVNIGITKAADNFNPFIGVNVRF